MLKRRLIFHRWNSVKGKPDFDPVTVAQHLETSIQHDSEYAILETTEAVTAIEVTSIGRGAEPTNLRLFALRGEDDRPFKYDSTGQVNPIAFQDSEYPADVTHISLWPDGICAQDYAKDVPRISRLSQFLRKKDRQYVNFDALYREDMREKLESMKGQLRSVEVAMTGPHRRTTGVFGTLVPAAFGQKAPSIRFTLGMGRYGPRDRYLNNETEEEVFALAEQADNFVSNMIIKGRNKRTQRVETVNLLHERLQVETRVARSTRIPSMPKPGEVFAELDRAYKEFQQQGSFNSALRGESMRNRGG